MLKIQACMEDMLEELGLPERVMDHVLEIHMEDLVQV